jgi:ubiquitin-protein ligase
MIILMDEFESLMISKIMEIYPNDEITDFKSYCIGCYEKLSFNSTVYTTCGNIICSYKMEELMLDNDVTGFIKSNYEIFKLLVSTTIHAIKSERVNDMLDPFPNHFLKAEYKTQLVKEKRGSLLKLQLNKEEYEQYNKAKDIRGVIKILDSFDMEVIKMYPTDQSIVDSLGKSTYILLRFIIKSCCLDISIQDMNSDMTVYKINHPFYVENRQNQSEDKSRCYMYHGSQNDAWYSILRNGIKILSNTSLQANGMVHGVGIYVSDSYNFAAGYSNNIVGVYEIIGKKETYYKSHNIYVIPTHELCLLRYLIVSKQLINRYKYTDSKAPVETIETYFTKNIINKKSEIDKKKQISMKKIMNEYKKLQSTVYSVELKAMDCWMVTYDGVTINIKFPELFPFEPPFIYIVSPQFNNMAVNITKDGAICCEYLTKSNWLPAISIESIVVMIFSEIINPNLINIMNHSMNHYNEDNAIISYEKLAKGNGWI